jgi:hypothetical protein
MFAPQITIYNETLLFTVYEENIYYILGYINRVLCCVNIYTDTVNKLTFFMSLL